LLEPILALSVPVCNKLNEELAYSPDAARQNEQFQAKAGSGEPGAADIDRGHQPLVRFVVAGVIRRESDLEVCEGEIGRKRWRRCADEPHLAISYLTLEEIRTGLNWNQGFAGKHPAREELVLSMHGQILARGACGEIRGRDSILIEQVVDDEDHVRSGRCGREYILKSRRGGARVAVEDIRVRRAGDGVSGDCCRTVIACVLS